MWTIIALHSSDFGCDVLLLLVVLYHKFETINSQHYGQPLPPYGVA